MKLFTAKKKEIYTVQPKGITKNKTELFNSIRNSNNNKLSIEKARIRCRLDKLLDMYKTKSLLQLSLYQTFYEKEIVPWNTDSKICNYCYKKKSYICRLCGEPICKRCTKEIPLKDFDPKLFYSLILCKGLCFNETLVYQKL